jgi:hypothetical protein
MTTTSLVKTSAAGFFLSLLIVGCSQNDQSQLTGPESSPSIATATTKPVDPNLSGGDNSERIRIQARLFATEAGPATKGRARWENRSDRIKFTTELQHVVTSGAHEVKVNGLSVGFVSIALGRGELELDTEHGDTVPSMTIGDLVEVFNPTGAVIASGHLQ